MTKQEKANEIAQILDDLYPTTPIPLDHESPYTLLIAVLLSAQCTDVRVNQVTPHLFAKAATPFDMILLDEPFSHLDIENVKIASELIQESCAQNKAGFIHVSLGDDYFFNYNEKLIL